MAASKKSELGQFYTSRWAKVLPGLKVPKRYVVIEPFVGSGDLLNACSKDISVELYDIAPPTESVKGTKVIVRDTILHPPDYTGKFVLTNPPYIARNKSSDKRLFDRYKQNDLYKCFMQELMETNQSPVGGILILPLNFFSSVRKSDISLRVRFLRKYAITRLNIFDGQMFNDTTSAVCSFQFKLQPTVPYGGDTVSIEAWVYNSDCTSEVAKSWELNLNGMAMPGGHIHTLTSLAVEVVRLTRINDTEENEACKCDIVLHAVDGSARAAAASRIRLEYIGPSGKRVVDRTQKCSGRSSASFILRPSLGPSEQEQLCEQFNTYIDDERSKYNSMFLPAFREYTRKRIPFTLAFNIIRKMSEDIHSKTS